MTFSIKNRKKALVLAVVLILAGGIFVLAAPQAKASLIDYFSTGGIYKLIGDILSVIQRFFAIFLNLAASLLDGVFQIGKFRNIAIVDAGWQVTRGLCNMFFALILLVMAVSTVLQVETFGIKKILPRLVIAALLINFSLLFAGVIIDFSQVLTGYFIDSAKGSSTISQQLMNGLNIGQALGGKPDPNLAPKEFCGTTAMAECTPPLYCVKNADDTYSCKTPVEEEYMQIKKAEEDTNAGTLNIVIGYAFSVIITIIATFVVLAAAILLIFRIVALWLLLIFAPLAWVSMIVPGTMAGSLWDKWWSYFLKWTFFAPIYAFFIYLAILAVGSGSFGKAFSKVKSDPNLAESFSSLTSSVHLVLQYIVIIIILVGGLYVAQALGITGAGAIMSWGKKAGKGAAKWSGKQAMRPAQFGYEKASAAATAATGKALSAVGLSKFGGRLQAKAVQMKQKPEERKQHKAYANLLKTMSDADLMNETKSAWGVRKLIAAREAKERGTLAKTEDTKAVQGAMKTFAAYGAKGVDGKTKDERDLEETRFDAIADENERSKAIRRSKESGNLDKVNAVVFKDPTVMKAVMDELTPPEFNETYKKWGKLPKKAANSAMADNLDPNSNFAPDAPDMKYRKNYASATGDLVKAFGTAAKQMKGAADQAAGEFIKAMKPSQIGDIFEGAVDEAGRNYGEASLKLVGTHIDKSMLASTTGELNAAQKAIITQGIKSNKNRQDIEDYMDKSPAWGGRIPGPAAGGARPQPQRPEQGEGPSF